MKKLTKFLTIALVLSFSLTSNAHAKKSKNPTLKMVRKTLWYMGVTGPSTDDVEQHIANEEGPKDEYPTMPEELKKALSKAAGL